MTHDRHGLGDVRRLRSRDARHSPCRQAQPTPRTDHLPDQSVTFRYALAALKSGVREQLIAFECID